LHRSLFALLGILELIILSKLSLINFVIPPLLTHPPVPLINLLVLLLGEASVLVVLEELLSETPLGLLLGESLRAHVVLVSHDRPDLEELRQLLRVRSLVEPVRVDVVTQLQGFQVRFQLLGQLYLRHLTPGFTRGGLSLGSTFFLKELHVV